MKIKGVAERVGFEPTYRLLARNPISSRARYDLFGTSPAMRTLSESEGRAKENWELLYADVGKPERGVTS